MTSENESSSSNLPLHPVFTKDPSEWMALIHKEVQVMDVKGKTHRGFVYTIDPVSEIIALITFIEQKKCCFEAQTLKTQKQFSFTNDKNELLQCSELKLITGPSIKDISVIPEDEQSLSSASCEEVMDTLFRPSLQSTYNLSNQQLSTRKTKLIDWLRKHHLPLEILDDGRLCIGGTLYINEPYTSESCICNNEIVLGRVQGIMKNMPVDIH